MHDRYYITDSGCCSQLKITILGVDDVVSNSIDRIFTVKPKID